MVSDYQFDPLKNQITHIDFLAINMTEERTVDVPVHLVGEGCGAKEGGVNNHYSTYKLRQLQKISLNQLKLTLLN